MNTVDTSRASASSGKPARRIARVPGERLASRQVRRQGEFGGGVHAAANWEKARAYGTVVTKELEMASVESRAVYLGREPGRQTLRGHVGGTTYRPKAARRQRWSLQAADAMNVSEVMKMIQFPKDPKAQILTALALVLLAATPFAQELREWAKMIGRWFGL
jgi:hypothetical protein